SREEEMGDRVWQVQKQLEELQSRCENTAEMTPEDLKAQLAEKTTLLSEARLKEQEFVERVSVRPAVGQPKSSVFPETCGLWQKQSVLSCCIDLMAQHICLHLV
ncbi:hypothetical protein XENORESO_003026, partial [Xenotaenia resolanae]